MARTQLRGKVTFERGRSFGGRDHRERSAGPKVGGVSGCYSQQGLHATELSKQERAVVADTSQGSSQNKTGLRL